MRQASTIAKRLVEAALLILAVIVFNFMLVHLAPGDVVDALSSGAFGDASEEVNARLREQLKLDEPVLVQLGAYIGNVLQGDFGYSPVAKAPVMDLILPRVGPTLLLAISSLAFAVVLGVAIGTYAARRPESGFSHSLTVFSLIGFAMPVFWTGLLLLIVFGVWLQWLPISGMVNLRLPRDATLIERGLDVVHHLILPTVSLGVIFLASFSRLARASMLEVLQSDYVRTARAKGLPERTVLYKHALRNGLIPIVTIHGMEFGVLLSGAILVETVFAWPGLGRLAFTSVLTRDTSVLLAILTLVSVTVILANALTDIVYRLIDPRLRVPEAT